VTFFVLYIIYKKTNHWRYI